MDVQVQNAIPTAEFRELFGPNPNCPTLTISSDWLWNYASVELPVLAAYEQFVLTGIVQAVSPRLIVEYGTGRGSGTVGFAANAPKDARVYTVDLDRNERGEYTDVILRGASDVGSAYKSSPHAGCVTQVLVRPGQPMPPVLAALAGTVDLVFVDGDHTYQGVRTDTLAALELAAPNATIVWHDFYDFPDYIGQGPDRRGVFPWLNEFAAQQTYQLFHVSGTYIVVGRRTWPKDIKGRLRQPGDRPPPFGTRIARQGDA
jgi:hypothetical protein